jgi:hypothetical protein
MQSHRESDRIKKYRLNSSSTWRMKNTRRWKNDKENDGGEPCEIDCDVYHSTAYRECVSTII